MPTPSPPHGHSSYPSTSSHATTQHIQGQEKEQLRYPDTPVSQTTTLPPVTTLTEYAASAPLHSSVQEQAGRSFGVHNILNPTTDDTHSGPVQRVSRSPVRRTSAAHGVQQLPGLISPRIRKRQDLRSPFLTQQPGSEQRPGRRMLTPKSPSLRSISQAMRDSPSLPQISRSVTGPGEGRSYYVEPGESASSIVPPLPPIPRSYHPYPAHSLPNEHSTNSGLHRQSNASTAYLTQSYPGSPSGSSDSLGREDTSPSQQGLEHNHDARIPSSRNYAGQPAYQMNLQTEQGIMTLPIAVDIQQASKVADEKRKRNAGASARFRQRRKEKEQAASATISDLNRKIQVLSDEKEFYKGERNALRDFIERIPGVQIPQRPSSPHRARSQYVSAPTDYSAGSDYSRQNTTEPSPAQRRRTNDYQPTFVAQSRQPAPYHPQFAPAPVTPYGLPPPQHPAVPTSHLDNRLQHLRPIQQLPTAQKSGSRAPPFDPLRPDTKFH